MIEPADEGPAAPEPAASPILRGILGWRDRIATPAMREAMFLVLTEAVGGVLGFAFWVAAARGFTDRDLGVGAVLISSGTLVAILSTLGFNVSLIRFLPEGRDPSRLVNTAVTLGVGVAMVLAIGFGLAAGTLAPVVGFLATQPALLALFAVFAGTWTMFLLMDAALIALRRARHVLIRSAVYNGLKVPLPFALVAVLAPAYSLFAAWGVGLLVANAVAALVLFRRALPGYRLRPALDRSAVGPMVRYSVANHATNVLGALAGLLFPLLIASVRTPEEAGYFYIAWTLANLLYIVPGAIFTSVFAEGSRRGSTLKGNAADGLFLSLLIVSAGVVGVLVAGPWVLAALKPTFLAAVPLLGVLSLTGFFVAVNSLYIAVRRVGKRMGPVLLLFAGTTLGAFGLGVPLLFAFGIVGAGIAVATVHGVAAALSARALIREGVLGAGGR